MFNDVQKIESVSLAIEEHFGIPATDEKHSKIFRLCILYGLKQLSAKDFQDGVNGIVGKKVGLDFRCALTQSVYFLRDVRAFVLKMSTRGIANFKKYVKKYDIQPTDVVMLRKNYIDIKNLDVESSVINRVCNTKGLDAKLSEIIGEIKLFCERHVRSKLFFILSSCNYEVHDLVSELLCKAISTFYWTSIEVKSKLHTINSIKLACKNHARNMINYFTAKKRSRLNKTGDNTFALTVVSENQLSRPTQETEEVAPFEDMFIADNTASMILAISVNQIQEKFANYIERGKNVILNNKKLKFVRLLMGYHDLDFSKYLKTIGINCCNDEYQDKVQPKRYIEVLANYLDLSKIVCNSLLEKLRGSLA